MPKALDAAAALADWRQWPLALTAPPTPLGVIPGGRTNRNIKIAAPGLPEPVILRLNNCRSSDLGIDRAAEASILRCAANAGIAPKPLYQDPQHRFTLLPFIHARTWQREDFTNPRQRQRLLPLLHRVRQLTPNTPRRCYYAYLAHYMGQLKAAGAVSEGLAHAWRGFSVRLKAFDNDSWPAQLTHHDLIPDNILDTGDRLYLIDWEYAALGHADIDLWCLDPALVKEPFIPELAQWTNDLWERVIAQQPPTAQ